jgi:antitoxin YefM
VENDQALFGDRELEIVVSAVDETTYLLQNEANREHLLRAVQNVNNQTNLVEVRLEDLV